MLSAKDYRNRSGLKQDASGKSIMAAFNQQLKVADVEPSGVGGRSGRGSPYVSLASRELRSRKQLQRSLDAPSLLKGSSAMLRPSSQLTNRSSLASSQGRRANTVSPLHSAPTWSPSLHQEDDQNTDDGSTMGLLPNDSKTLSGGVWDKLQDLDHLEREARAKRFKELSARKPEVVTQMENLLQSHLKVLHSSPTPPNPRERLQCFQEVGRQCSDKLGSFSSLITQILYEYDTFIEAADVQQRRICMLEAELDELRREKLNETSRLNQELKKRDQQHAEDLAMIDVRMKEGPSMIDLMRTVDMQTHNLEEEKKKRMALEDKLGATAHIRRDFERTIRSIEETFQVISDEKDIQIGRLTNEARFRREQLTEAEEQAIDAKMRSQHRIDTLEIEVQTLRHRENILMGRVRDHELKNNKLVDSLQAANTELDALEERLAQFEGIPDFVPKDVAMTPRPGRGDIAQAIPALGDINKFQSTTALVKAIVERYADMERQVRESEDMISCLEGEIGNRLDRIKAEERESFSQLEELRRQRVEGREADDAGKQPEQEAPAEAVAVVVEGDTPTAGRRKERRSMFCEPKTNEAPPETGP